MMAGEKTIVFEKINDVYSFIKDGRFQLLTVMVCCLATFPMGLQSLILYFLAFDPGWKCVPDSLVCTHNGTIRNSDTLYRARCNMNRTDWMYVTSDKFSIVTEVDHSLIIAICFGFNLQRSTRASTDAPLPVISSLICWLDTQVKNIKLYNSINDKNTVNLAKWTKDIFYMFFSLIYVVTTNTGSKHL